MKATSRDSRSSFATTTGHFAERAAARAAASWGRREGIRAFASLDLSELGDLGDVFGLGEAGHGRLLGLDAEPGAALALGRDPIVGDEWRGAFRLFGIHTNCIPPFAVCMKVRLCRDKLRKITDVLERLPDVRTLIAGSYAAQEVQTLRSDLAALQRVTERRLDTLTAPIDPIAEAKIDADLDRFARWNPDDNWLQQLWNQQDFRNWRAHIIASIQAREDVAEQHQLIARR